MNQTTDHDILLEAERDRKAAQAELRDLEARCDLQRKKLAEMEIVVNYIRSKIISGSPDAEEKTVANQSPQNKNGELMPAEISYIDATIKILEDAGTWLHINDIVSELEKRFGKINNAKNVAGNIRKDSLNRFINLGGNRWDLSSRHAPTDAQKTGENENGVVASTTTPLFSSNKGGN